MSVSFQRPIGVGQGWVVLAPSPGLSSGWDNVIFGYLASFYKQILMKFSDNLAELYRKITCINIQ